MTHRLYTVVAELTYRCPLRCLYCSNPLDFAAARDELTTAQWANVFRQAAALGALQLHLSGGEPTLRADLPELVRAARDADLYVNLITAGTLLDDPKLDQLRASGLDHIQLSLQDSDRDAAEMVAGTRCFERKLAVAAMIRKHGFPLTLNVVLHRHNLARVPELIELALELGADRLELANTQYYGWALQNRAALLPTRDQNETAEQVIRAAREQYRDKLEIAFVRADYFADRPKACMGGWAQSYLCITPSGAALPCHAATAIRGLNFDNVRDSPLADIWNSSPALNAFRGEDWMIEPCRSCPNRKTDFGGCRCQAFILTGDARAADPVCSLSPAHEIVTRAFDAPRDGHLVYRDATNSRRL
jgi:pyrroloquinoline quinone biosynthesis protein E